MPLLRYFLLKLISRKNAITALFLSEIDFTKNANMHYFFLKLISRKNEKNQSYVYVGSNDALLSWKKGRNEINWIQIEYVIAWSTFHIYR